MTKIFQRWLQTRQKKQKIQPSQISKNRERFGMGKLHQVGHQAGFLCGTRSRQGDGAFPSGFEILLVTRPHTTWLKHVLHVCPL
jgi:hypothetical protein